MHIAQVLDSPDYMKKVLITNKVTTHFFITPFKSVPYTLHLLPTAFSRINITLPLVDGQNHDIPFPAWWHNVGNRETLVQWKPYMTGM